MTESPSIHPPADLPENQQEIENPNALRVQEFSSYLELRFTSALQRNLVQSWFTFDDPKSQRRHAFGTEDAQTAQDFSPNAVYRLPAGFVDRLRRHTAQAQIPVNWASSVRLEAPVPFQQMLKRLDTDEGGPLVLDPDQIEACRTLLSNKRCALEFATGGGKSEIALNAWACLRDSGVVRRTLIVVPTTALRKQMIARIQMRSPWAEHTGTIGGGRFDASTPIVVATVQSACGHENLRHSLAIQMFLQEVDLLIIDEAHHASSSQYLQILKSCPAPRVWALSGKLTYNDDAYALKQMNLEALFGPPALRGRSGSRTCPTKVVFYHDESWRGRFDGHRLPAKLVDLTPCVFQRQAGVPWETGFYRGPDWRGNVPDLCKKPCPQDIVDWSPSGKPIYCQEAMKLDWNAEPFGEVRHYDPSRMIADPDKYGVYVAGPCNTWTHVPSCHEVIYENLQDTAQMLFEPRNEWALKLASTFAERREPFVITVKRTWHLRRLTSMMKKAGLKVARFDGSTSADDRTALLTAMREGELHGLVATYSTISEGIDIPNLVHLVKLDGVSDEQVLTQQVGRVQRVNPGKRFGYVHIPVDLQERSLALNCEKMKAYYRTQPEHTQVREIHHPGASQQ